MKNRVRRPCGSGHDRHRSLRVAARKSGLGEQLSSTTCPGHTRATSASLPRTAPRASISANSTSKARPPSLIGRLSASSSRRCGITRKRPNSTARRCRSEADSIERHYRGASANFRLFQGTPERPLGARAGSRTRVRGARPARERVEKRLCSFQIGRAEALGKVIVDGLKQRKRLRERP